MARMNEYRIIENYGRYFNKRYEVQEKYSYINENGEKIEAWHMVYHSTDKNKCIETMEKYKARPKKDRVSFDVDVWSWRRYTEN